MKRSGFWRRFGAGRAGRVLLLGAIFLSLATIVPAPPLGPPAGPGEALFTATPIPLDDEDAGRRRAGALIYLRGWQLTSSEPRFGGISAMHVEGGRVLAISDAGVVIEFALPGLSSDRRVRFQPLPRGPGPPLPKSNRDTESLSVRDGQAWIGFERHNMVWRYRRPGWIAEAAARPAAMRRWSRNAGPETLLRLADGRFLAIAEGPDGAAFSDVALFDGDPAEASTEAVTLRYRRPDGFRPTDAALLPDGRLLILNRSISLFGGMAAKLVLIESERLEAGAILEGREIGELRSPLTVDNMEALSVALENGRTIVRIASDDNFLSLQRTLLLEFVLDEGAVRRPRSPTASSRPRASGGAPSG